MSHSKPIIGITGPDKGGLSAWIFTSMAVRFQGGKAVRITPSKPKNGQNIDGLILGGGADIDPQRYGQKLIQGLPGKHRPKPDGARQWFLRILSFVFYPILLLVRKLFSTKTPAGNHKRDELEFSLLDRAIKKGIPVLGICRGAQLINVQLGGTLHQDITSFYREIPEVHTIWPEKKVDIKSGSKLESALGISAAWVNALHHQAVDQLGDSLQIVAREEAGIAQAIETTGHTFLIGVQWHPEYMPQIPEQRNLFAGLIKAAGERLAK